MKVLELTVHLFPNVGGVETHLKDLVTLLKKKGWEVTILAYRPLSTTTKWKIYENHSGLEILRLPWFTGLWFNLTHYPLLEFLYLFPIIFIVTPFVLLVRNPVLIHAHGLIAASAAAFWAKIFRKDLIISTHNIYSFPPKSLYRNFAKVVFSQAKENLCLSKQSCEELKNLGVKNVNIFTYWIDLKKFKKVENAKIKIGWKDKFTVLFVGRLIPEKGIKILLESATKWNKNICLVFVGTGPLENNIKRAAYKNPRIKFLGKTEQEYLPTIYSASDILIVPSTSEEGFGRVIMESLACSTPVVASKLGGIPEAMDKTVGRVIKVSSKTIKETIEDLYMHPQKLYALSKNARRFAERRFSEKNGNRIIEAYSN